MSGKGVLGFSVGGSNFRQVEEDGGGACSQAGLLRLFSQLCFSVKFLDASSLPVG